MARAKLTAVVDASPVIALYAADMLGLLPHLFDPVFVPMAVALELTAAAGGSPELEELRRLPGVTPDATCFVRPRRLAVLHAGEIATIAIARCRGATAVLDDLAGRRAARDEGCHVIGTVGILLEARRRSLVGALKPLLDQLIGRGFWLSPQLVEEALRQVGE